MANAAEARGFDTVLWPTVLSHNGLLANQPKKGEQAESAEEQQRNIKTAADAAANALRLLKERAPPGLRVLDHSIRSAFPEGNSSSGSGDTDQNVQEALATMATGSIFSSAFGAGGSAILSYLGGSSHCILCDDFMQQNPAGAPTKFHIGSNRPHMNGLLKGRFCRREILESMSGQAVTIVGTQEDAITCVERALAASKTDSKGHESDVQGSLPVTSASNNAREFYPYPLLYKTAAGLWQHEEEQQSQPSGRGSPPLKVGGKMHEPSPVALQYLCRVFKQLGAGDEVKDGMAPARGFEFGPELVIRLPVVYFLHQCGMVTVTKSCGDLSVFYYFSERHENHECHRRGGGKVQAGTQGSYWEYSPVAFLPPPLRKIYSAYPNPIPFANSILNPGEGAQTKTVVITGRLDCRPCSKTHQPQVGGADDSKDLCCKQYLSNDVLRQVIKAINEGARTTGMPTRIIYNRVNHADKRLLGLSREQGDGYADTGHFSRNFTRVCPRGGCFAGKSERDIEDFKRLMVLPVSEIRDEEMLRAEFPDVIILADSYFTATHDQHENISFNEFLVRTLSHADSFVSVQGGSSYLVSYFGGCNEVCDFYGHFNHVKDGRIWEKQEAARAARKKQEEAKAEQKHKKSPMSALGLQDLHHRRRQRRLHETEQTYSTTLPRMGGGQVNRHGTGAALVEAVKSWWTNPACGLMSAAAAERSNRDEARV